MYEDVWEYFYGGWNQCVVQYVDFGDVIVLYEEFWCFCLELFDCYVDVIEGVDDDYGCQFVENYEE